ncbi:IS3 family transposase [Autumnicola musiva]|uniref:IS3 family transposase n=1 Tax=Autumnicola musiva TaxID=3075589 RepID=UPI003D77A2A4
MARNSGKLWLGISTIKVELIYRTRYERKEQAALAVFEWIETLYNRNRRHSALGNRTILEFEELSQFKNVA